MQFSPPNSSLWQRLIAWSPDDPDAAHPFSQKLAHEQRWSSEFAHRAIEEYRRFVYLSCTLPGGASPSPLVDEVWHLHLTYTVDYWKHFCPDVLQRDLHHHPSKGGADQRRHHVEWYAATLKEYERHFGAPPPDLWPSPAAAPQKPSRFKFRHAWWLLLLLLPSLLTGMLYGQPVPFLLSGPHFLLYFTVFSLISLALLFRALRNLEHWLGLALVERGGVDEHEAAYLAGGRERLFLYLFTSLISDKCIVNLKGTGKYHLNERMLQQSASPVANSLLLNGVTESMHTNALCLHASGTVSEVQARFYALKNAFNARFALAGSWLLPVFLLILIRLLQAGYNGRPVGNLLACAAVAGIIGFLLFSAHRLHQSAARVLRSTPQTMPSPPTEFNRNLIFGGVAAIAGWAAFSQLATDFRQTSLIRNGESSSSSGGGGGAGSGCGSSCGSSCGGGGCGGCGGD